MSQWGKQDNAANSVFWGSALVKHRETTANQTALFNNANNDTFILNAKHGVFGVSDAEFQGKGAIDSVSVEEPGDGYTDVALVSFTGGNTTPAEAEATGKIVEATRSEFTGSGWDAGDTVVIDETGATNTTPPELVVATVEVGSITLGSNTGTGYANGDTLTVNSGTGTQATANVAEADANGSLVSITLLTAGSYTAAPTEEDSAVTTDGDGIDATVNVTSVIETVTITESGEFSQLPDTIANNEVTTDGNGFGGINLSFGVAAVNVTANGAGYFYSNVGISFANGSNTIASVTLLGDPGQNIRPAHTGWVLRTEGTGGRAGRIQTEVLVASKSITGDAADDDTYGE